MNIPCKGMGSYVTRDVNIVGWSGAQYFNFNPKAQIQNTDVKVK